MSIRPDLIDKIARVRRVLGNEFSFKVVTPSLVKRLVERATELIHKASDDMEDWMVLQKHVYAAVENSVYEDNGKLRTRM